MNFSINGFVTLTIYVYIISNGLYYVKSMESSSSGKGKMVETAEMTRDLCKSIISTAFGGYDKAFDCIKYVINCIEKPYEGIVAENNPQLFNIDRRNKIFSEYVHYLVFDYKYYLLGKFNYSKVDMLQNFCNEYITRVCPDLTLEEKGKYYIDCFFDIKNTFGLDGLQDFPPDAPRQYMNIDEPLPYFNKRWKADDIFIKLYNNAYGPIKIDTYAYHYIMGVANHGIIILNTVESAKDVAEYCKDRFQSVTKSRKSITENEDDKPRKRSAKIN